MLYLRSFLYWLGLLASTLLMVVVLLLVWPLPFRLRQRISIAWPVFNLWWLRLTCGLHHEVHGREHIPTQAAVYVCKHQSAWETIAMETVVPRMVWVLKRELMWVPIFGWGLATLKPIAIKRDQGRKAIDQLIEEGRDRLADGINVVIFPEGTRVAPGEKSSYRPGAALLAAKTGALVVPMAHNAGYFWPRRGFLKYPGVIQFVIGPPIDASGMSASQINRRIEEWIETKVAEIGGPQERV